LVLFLAAAPHPERFFTPDSDDYVALGRHFPDAYAARAGGFFDLGLLRTPGYPLLIHGIYAVVGEDPRTVILVQVMLSALTIWLIYVVGLGLFGPTAAWFASLAVAIDPISIVMPNYLQPEVLFTFALIAGSLCWLRALRYHSYGWSAGAGLLLGASVLIRPIALYLPLFLVPVGWIYRSRWATGLALSGVFLLTFALPVAGWIVRNYQLTGIPLLSTVQSINLLDYRAAGAVAEDEGLSVAEARRRLGGILEERTQVGMNPAEISRLETELSFETLAHHPMGMVVTGVKGVFRLLAAPGRAELLRLLGADNPMRIETGLQALLVGVEILVLGVILPSAVWGCYALLRSRKYFELIAVVTVITYFVMASAGLEASSRFRAPIMPYFALLAGCAAASRLRCYSEKGHGGRDGVVDERSEQTSEVNRRSFSTFSNL
jgi:hypothetical protein